MKPKKLTGRQIQVSTRRFVLRQCRNTMVSFPIKLAANDASSRYVGNS
jgi:hypothetical protein